MKIIKLTLYFSTIPLYKKKNQTSFFSQKKHLKSAISIKSITYNIKIKSKIYNIYNMTNKSNILHRNSGIRITKKSKRNYS